MSQMSVLTILATVYWSTSLCSAHIFSELFPISNVPADMNMMLAQSGHAPDIVNAHDVDEIYERTKSSTKKYVSDIPVFEMARESHKESDSVSVSEDIERLDSVGSRDYASIDSVDSEVIYDSPEEVHHSHSDTHHDSIDLEPAVIADATLEGECLWDGSGDGDVITLQLLCKQQTTESECNSVRCRWIALLAIGDEISSEESGEEPVDEEQSEEQNIDESYDIDSENDVDSDIDSEDDMDSDSFSDSLAVGAQEMEERDAMDEDKYADVHLDSADVEELTASDESEDIVSHSISDSLSDSIESDVVIEEDSEDSSSETNEQWVPKLVIITDHTDSIVEEEPEEKWVPELPYAQDIVESADSIESIEDIKESSHSSHSSHHEEKVESVHAYEDEVKDAETQSSHSSHHEKEESVHAYEDEVEGLIEDTFDQNVETGSSIRIQGDCVWDGTGSLDGATMAAFCSQLMEKECLASASGRHEGRCTWIGQLHERSVGNGGADGSGHQARHERSTVSSDSSRDSRDSSHSNQADTAPVVKACLWDGSGCSGGCSIEDMQSRCSRLSKDEESCRGIEGQSKRCVWGYVQTVQQQLLDPKIASVVNYQLSVLDIVLGTVFFVSFVFLMYVLFGLGHFQRWWANRDYKKVDDTANDVEPLLANSV